MHKSLMTTSALIAVMLAAPAFAQVASNAPASTAAANADDGISEIVVTAQRKTESAQKAGIAIDAVTGSALAERGITSAIDITKSVPAISLPAAGGAIVSIFMRGVGNITSSSYADPAVVPSYDGVVLGRGGGLLGAAFYDLSRVEVLKGPQGILYGRNATGGAINIIPMRPQLGKTGAGINAGYGNYNAFDVNGFVNLATSTDSALRVAGSYKKHDGYNRDGSDDADVASARAQFLVEPSSDLSLRLGADYTHLGGQGRGGTYLGAFQPGPTGYGFAPASFDTSEGFNTAAANAFRQTVLGAPGFGFLMPMNAKQKIDSTYWGVNAELNWTTGIGKFTVIPAYRKSTDNTLFYGPAFNTANTNEKINQFSIEARLSGSRGPIDYVVGTFYFNEKIQGNNEYNQEFVLPIQSYTHKTDSVAAFGQLTAHVTDRFRLIGGARFTNDKKSMDGIINNFITFCGGLPGAGQATPPASFGVGCANPGALPYYPNFLNTGDTINWLTSNGWIDPTTTDQANPQVLPLLNGVGAILKTYSPVVASGSYSRVTWKAGAEFDVTQQNLLYATVASGYHAGGFQLAEGHPNYKPEFITAYTIGSKNRFFDNKLQLNLEGFLWKYRDQQITYFTVDTSGTLINSTENAGKATIKGLDVDLVARPMANTTLNAKVQYLDAKYDDLQLYTAAPRDNIACPFTLTGQVAGGAPVKDFNCSGNPLLFSPKWTVNLGVEQIVPLGDNFELVGNVNTAWRDDQWGAFEYLAFEHISAYWTTDAALTLRRPNGSWSITGYIRNIENKRRDTAPQSSPLGVAVGHYTAPQTYGIRVSAQF